MKNGTLTVFGLSGQSIFMTVDEFHKPEETKTASSIYIEAGGKGHNQAVAARRQGVSVNFVAAYGRDEFAKYAITELSKDEVTVYPIYKDGMSAYATILIDKNGNNQVTVYQGVNSLLTVEDVLPYEELIKNSEMVLLQFEMPLAVVKQIIAMANKHDVLVMLNPAPLIKATDLGKIDIITPNEHEQAILSQAELDVRNVIITKGGKGVSVKTIDEEYDVSALAVKAVDTTGAGDVFNGSLAAYLLKGMSLREATQTACIAAGLSVCKAHVIASIPYFEDVENIKKVNR